MRNLGTLWWCLAFWGCTDSTADAPGNVDMQVDRAAPDSRIDDQGQPDLAVDAGIRNPPEPLDPRTCLPPAAQRFDAVVTLDYTTLHLGDAAIPLAGSRLPIGVSVSPAADRIVLVRAGMESCQIEGRDGNGDRVWQVDVPGTCQQVAISDLHVWAPVDVEGGAMWILDIETGAVERQIALPARPTTAPGFGGLDENGGSHWYVGAGRQLLRITPQADWAVMPVDLDIEVRALALADARWAVVLGAMDPQADGLGTHAQRIALDSLSAQVPLALPGPAYAAPVVLPPCSKWEANGGSHWWCSDGMFAVAGDGWLNAWTLLDQRPRIDAQQPDGLRITGLAVGRDGLIYNGGSHWRDGGWRLQAQGLNANTLLTEGVGNVCLSAPLLDTDGRLFTHHLNDTVRWETRSGGHPPGWARARGDVANRGRPVDASCLGGTLNLFTRLHVNAEPIRPIVARVVEGDVLIAGVEGAGETARTWLGRVAPDGVLRWDVRVPALPDVQPAVDLPVSIAPRLRILEMVQSAGRFLRTHGFSADGVVQGSAQISDEPRDLQVEVATSGPPEVVLTGTFTNDPRQQWLFNTLGDFFDQLRFVEHAEPFVPQAVQTLTPGWVTAAQTPTGIVVEAVDGDAEVRWQVPVMNAQAEAVAIDIEVSAQERVFILLAEPAGTHLLTMDRDGQRLGQTRYPDARPAGLALQPDGSGMLLFDDLSVAPVTAAGAIGPAQPLPIPGIGVEILALDEGYAVVGHDGLGALVLARISREGYASCAAAGRCVAPIDCAGEACEIALCQPQTGACAVDVLPDGMPCGNGLTCAVGQCGP